MPTFTSYKSGMQVPDEPIYRSQFPGFALPVAGTGVAGRVAFWSGTGTISSNSNFLYDTVTGNAAIGTTTNTAFLNLGLSTATKANMRFDLGANYTTLAAMTMWANATSGANHFAFFDGLNHFKFGQKVGTPSTSALYMGEATPSTTNWSMQHATAGNTDINSVSNIQLMIGGVARLSVLGGTLAISAGYAINAPSGIRGGQLDGTLLNIGYNSAVSLGTGFGITGRNVCFPGTTYNDSSATAGPIVVVQNPHVCILRPTYSATTSGRTITDAATLQIDDAPLASGPNIAITNPWAFRVVAGASRFGGSIDLPLVQKTANYTISIVNDFTIECTANSFTTTLPTAVGHRRTFCIVNSGTGTITLNTTSSQTIMGSLTQTINTIESLVVQSNGTNWIIL